MEHRRQPSSALPPPAAAAAPPQSCAVAPPAPPAPPCAASPFCPAPLQRCRPPAHRRSRRPPPQLWPPQPQWRLAAALPLAALLLACLLAGPCDAAGGGLAAAAARGLAAQAALVRGSAAEEGPLGRMAQGEGAESEAAPAAAAAAAAAWLRQSRSAGVSLALRSLPQRRAAAETRKTAAAAAVRPAEASASSKRGPHSRPQQKTAGGATRHWSVAKEAALRASGSSDLASEAAAMQAEGTATATAGSSGGTSSSTGKEELPSGKRPPQQQQLPLASRPLRVTRLKSPDWRNQVAAAKRQQQRPGSDNDSDGPATGNATAAPPNRFSVLGQQNHNIHLQQHGGIIMSNRIRVYLIFYGQWAPAGRKVKIVEAFVRSLGNSSLDAPNVMTVHKWWSINSLYTQPNGRRGSVQVEHKASVFVSTTRPLMSDADVGNVARGLMKAGKIRADANAIYAVLTSPDVQVGNSSNGYCITYCGYHSSFKQGGYRMKYLFASDASFCGGCAGSPTSLTPNGDFGVDNMCDTVAHELTEALTDPDVATGWFDPNNGNENADSCNTFYPNIKWAGNAPYNLVGVDGHKWLIQSNVNPQTQLCMMQLAKPATG